MKSGTIVKVGLQLQVTKIAGLILEIAAGLTYSSRMKRYSIPPALKRWLVPVWNSAHWYIWLTYDYLNALGHGRVGRCVVCGQTALMLYRRRVIPPRLQELWGLSPPLADALARKESGDCSRCGAKLAAAGWPRSCYRFIRLAIPLLRRDPWLDGSSSPRSRLFESPKSTGSMGFMNSFCDCPSFHGPIITLGQSRDRLSTMCAART